MIKSMDEAELAEKLLQLVAHINKGPKNKWGVSYDTKTKTGELPFDQTHIDRFYHDAYCLLGTGLRQLPVKTRRIILSELKAN